MVMLYVDNMEGTNFIDCIGVLRVDFSLHIGNNPGKFYEVFYIFFPQYSINDIWR